ncbi:hypothetical protein Tco_0972677 [Tanacetum coccineum]
MTRSSTNELFTPYKEPEREFRSSRRHFKTLSLDELRSPDFNLLSDEEYSEEEEEEEMAETMEQYMSKTRTDYGSGVARPKIDNKDQFELKGQFLKELRENTFSGSDNEDANEHIEKEVILFYNGLNVPTRQILDSRGAVLTKIVADANTTKFQDMLNTLKNSTMEHLEEELDANNVKDPITPKIVHKRRRENPNEAYYTQFGGPFQGGGYRATALGYYQRNNANPSFQEQRQSMKDTLSKFISE